MSDLTYHVKGTCSNCLGKLYIEYTNTGHIVKGIIRPKPTGWAMCKCGFSSVKKSDVGAQKDGQE